MSHSKPPRADHAAHARRRAPATELAVVDLIAQHSPQANAQFARLRDARLPEAFLRQLASTELERRSTALVSLYCRNKWRAYR